MIIWIYHTSSIMNWFVIGLMIAIIFCGYLNDRNKYLPFLIMAIFFILTCFSYDANDYINYSRMYNLAGNGKEVNYEILFVQLMRISNFIGLSYDQFRMAIIVIELTLIYSTVKRYTMNCSMMWALFIIYPGWLLTTLLRHSLALSLIIFGTRYIELDGNRKQTVKLVICIVLASLIHSSYWVFLALILVNLLDPDKILKIAVIIVGITGVFVLIFGNIRPVVELISILPIRTNLINKYFNGYHQNIVGMLYSCFRQLLLIIYGLVPTYYYHKKIKERDTDYISKKDFLSRKFMQTILPINYCSLFVLCEAFFASNSSRLNQVIFVINLIAWVICINEYRYLGSRYIQREKLYLKSIAIVMPIIFSILQCTFESKVVFDNVLKMIFQTNTFLRW